MSSVREIALPADARALSTLGRVDYTDAFLVEPAGDRTPEEWARAMVAGASPATRKGLRRSWFALGLRLGSPEDDGLLLGWPLRRSGPDFALFGAGSRIGMPAELLFRRQDDGLLFATFLRLGNPLVRLLWAGVAPGHRRVVSRLLERAARREGRPRAAA
jgi:hypothetical protein